MSKANVYIPSPEEDTQIQAGIDVDPDTFEITEQMIHSGKVVMRGLGKQKNIT